MVSHRDVIYNYFNAVDRKHYRIGKNIFFLNDRLYSYDTHFMLAQKVKNGYILNGDSSSISTSKHQNYTRQEAPNNSPIISFSALTQILKTRDRSEIVKIEIIDKTDDTYEEYTYKDKNGDTQTGQRHHLGAALIKYRNKYFLSSIDPGSKNFQYFLVELPKSISGFVITVSHAFNLLAGNLTADEYNDYLEGKIKRQGEYFLIPDINWFTENIKKNYDLSKGRGNAHIATEAVKINKDLFIRGTLRHNEHKMISLDKIWHKVVKNTAVRSFTATGNVD